MKPLASLLQLLNITTDLNLTVTSLVTDSRKVEPGSLFCALKGLTTDGHDFIDAAFAKGANAVLCERLPANTSSYVQEKIFVIPDLYHKMGMLADFFYDHPSKQVKLIGVTGTNGKTSTSHYIAQLLYLLGEKAAVIGTAGNGLWGQLTESTHTTPDVVSLHKSLRGFVNQGAKWVVMEVSSHALEQNRLDGIDFYGAVFTNLTQDHLDYHKTMIAYGAAKTKLFHRPELKIAVLNQEDAFSQMIIKKIPLTTQCFFYDDAPKIKTQLLGAFNASNVNAALTILAAAQLPIQELTTRAALLQPVKGRMEGLYYPNAPLVVIDYAHTPDALAKAISALKASHKKIWVVFGCGGDRDTSKRPLMAKAAEALADQIIVTEDNSRTEAIEAIFADIATGFSHLKPVRFIADRTEAIRFALNQADREDIILLAGKGHETYMEKNGKKQHYDEREVVAVLLKDKTVTVSPENTETANTAAGNATPALLS